jgi:hypothetical protein
VRQFLKYDVSSSELKKEGERATGRGIEYNEAY